MAKVIYPTGWDIQITPAGPDSPIFKGGLRMNAVQKPAKSTGEPQKSLADNTAPVGDDKKGEP